MRQLEHLDDAALFAALEGRSGPGDVRHLGACSECRTALDKIVQVGTLFGKALAAIDAGLAAETEVLAGTGDLSHALGKKARELKRRYLAGRVLKAMGADAVPRLARAIAARASEGPEPLPMAAAPLDLTRPTTRPNDEKRPTKKKRMAKKKPAKK